MVFQVKFKTKGLNKLNDFNNQIKAKWKKIFFRIQCILKIYKKKSTTFMSINNFFIKTFKFLNILNK